MNNIKIPYSRISALNKVPGVYLAGRDYIVYLWKKDRLCADRGFNDKGAAGIYFARHSWNTPYRQKV